MTTRVQALRRWVPFANSDPRWRRSLAAAGAILWIAAAHSADAQESDPGSGAGDSRLPVGEVVWLAGKSLRFDSPAARLKETDYFACIRPQDAPRAVPEELKYQGNRYKLELVAADSKSGLCLLRSTSAAATEPNAGLSADASSWPDPAMPILAVDSGKAASVMGKIAGRDLIYQGRELPFTLLRINLDPAARIEHPLPLLDEGRTALVGFVIPQPLENPGEFHAIPAVFVAKLLRDHENLEKVARGKLGASFDVGSTTPQIVSIREDSAADRAGLKKGDVVLRIGDWKIRRLSDVIETLRTVTPSMPIDIDVLRGLETETFEVVPETAGSK